MDIASILNQDNNASNEVNLSPIDSKGSSTTDKLEFSPNETIGTNDNSAVGSYGVKKGPTISGIDDSINESNELKNPVDLSQDIKPDLPDVQPNPKSDFEVVDPAKMDFIKTYTKEFDDLVADATNAVQLILKSIDRTVKENMDSIEIPEEALKFLDKKPENNKVSKFVEAQEIVRSIMGKASDAKNNAEQAAVDASKVYDDIQKFKKDTSLEIERLKSRDQFGHVRNS